MVRHLPRSKIEEWIYIGKRSILRKNKTFTVTVDLSRKLAPKKDVLFGVFQARNHSATVDVKRIHDVACIHHITLIKTIEEAS